MAPYDAGVNSSAAHRLVVVRHAKAESYAASDAARALSERGRADAVAAGEWLREAAPVPGLALVSSATRTRETFSGLAEGAGWALEPTVEESLYSADEDSVLDLVRSTDEAVGTVLVVGHNPTVAMLAQLLDDGDGPAEAADRMATGYPTGGVAVFDVPCPWHELGPACARLRAFHVARG